MIQLKVLETAPQNMHSHTPGFSSTLRLMSPLTASHNCIFREENNPEETVVDKRRDDSPSPSSLPHSSMFFLPNPS